MVMMFTVTVKMGVSGTMGIIVPMLLTMKRRKWSIGTRIDFGVGAGEGLAAVCSHQSGVKGMRAAMPVFSREIEMALAQYSASRHFLQFYPSGSLKRRVRPSEEVGNRKDDGCTSS